MKTNHFLLTLTALLFTNLSGYAQDYIPLLMDSQYTWSWSAGFEGDTIISESWTGLSYDADNNITERRDPFGKLTYTYGTDTVFLLSKALDEAGNLDFFSRGTEVYEAGKIQSKLTERYTTNNEFENSARHFYFYDENQLDTLYLLQHWKEGEWVDFYKKTKTFDTNGNNTEEGEYYAYNTGVFEYSRGKLFNYDSANRLIQQTRLNGSATTPTSEAHWIYGDDGLLDSVQQCNYINGMCKNVYLETRDYTSSDSTIASRFSWSTNDQWEYYGKELTFNGQQVYSSRPDSVLFYTYWAEDMNHTLTHRQYFEYQDLGNDSIYYKATTYYYFEPSNVWKLTRLTEEWYHPQSTTGIRQNPDNAPNQLSVYPNPAAFGQQVRLKDKSNILSNHPVEILLFDLAGQLLTKTVLTDNLSFQAPNQQGVYTILVRQKERLLGVVKQVVVE